MGYSTTYMDKEIAMLTLKRMSKNEVESASDIKYFTKYPRITEVISAEKSDHGHIILRLKKGFVDYKLI